MRGVLSVEVLRAPAAISGLEDRGLRLYCPDRGSPTGEAAKYPDRGASGSPGTR
jgi:hypothetical protein